MRVQVVVQLAQRGRIRDAGRVVHEGAEPGPGGDVGRIAEFDPGGREEFADRTGDAAAGGGTEQDGSGDEGVTGPVPA